MKNLLLCFCLSAATFGAYAQSAGNSQLGGAAAEQNIKNLGNAGNLNGLVQTYDNRYDGVKGTPYFLDQWANASIALAGNKSMYAGVPVKYNVYENSLLYRKPNGKNYILDLSEVESFSLQDSASALRYSFKRLPAQAGLDAKYKDKFLLSVYEGAKSELLMLPDKAIIKADFKGGYAAGRTYDEIVTNNTYYFVKPGKPAEKVKLNKKSLLATLSDKQQAVEKFISANKLDLNTTAGWARALAYYETI